MVDKAVVQEAPKPAEPVQAAPFVEPVVTPEPNVDITKALSQLTAVFGQFIEQQTKGKGQIQAAIYRKAQARFNQDFPGWLKDLNVQEIVSVTQSESDGNITITLFYR